MARAAVRRRDRHRRQVRLDVLQRAPRGLALAGLLGDVVLRGGVGVGALEHGVGGHRVGLAVPAARAADDVGERGAELVGRRDEAVGARVAGHLEVRDEPGGPACCTAASRGGKVSRDLPCDRTDPTAANYDHRVAERRSGPAEHRRADARRGGHGARLLRARPRGGRRAAVGARRRRRRLDRRDAADPRRDRRARTAACGSSRCRATSATRRRSPPAWTTRTGNVVVMIDADLQDPPELITTMLDHWRAGSDVVYATRTDRVGESKFKLKTARVVLPHHGPPLRRPARRRTPATSGCWTGARSTRC